METKNKRATIVTTSVSKSKAVDWYGHEVTTGIFKLPVKGKIKVKRLNLAGDEQSDLTVHGGLDKAVYAYPGEHYHYWKEQLPDRELPHGMFGENLTTLGLEEQNVFIGDRLKVGSAVLQVTQPRMPCYKLGVKFGDPGIIKRFFRSGKWGIYFKVLEEGELEVGDTLEYLGGDEHKVKVSDVINALLDPTRDPANVYRVLTSNLADQMKGELIYMARNLAG
jgi:MOSC domain-containing protein YiiM